MAELHINKDLNLPKFTMSNGLYGSMIAVLHLWQSSVLYEEIGSRGSDSRWDNKDYRLRITQAVNNLRKATTLMQLLETKILYRTTQKRFLPTDLKIGSVWFEDFISSSFDPKTASSKTFGLGVNDRDCLLEIEAPKGTYGTEYNNIKNLNADGNINHDKFADEDEFLIPFPGLEVISIEKNEKDFWVIRCRIIDQEYLVPIEIDN